MRAVLSYVRVSLSTRIVIFPNADIKFHIIVTMKIFSSSFYRLLCYHMPNVNLQFHYELYRLKDRVLFPVQIPVSSGIASRFSFVPIY